MQVVASSQDDFDALVAVFVRLRAPDCKVIAQALPINAEEVALVRVSIAQEFPLVFVYDRREQVPVLFGADVVWQHLLCFYAILVLEEARDDLHVA